VERTRLEWVDIEEQMAGGERRLAFHLERAGAIVTCRDFTVEVEVGLDLNLREDVYTSAYGHVGSDGGCSLDADTGKADTDAHTEMVEDSMVIYSTFLG